MNPSKHQIISVALWLSAVSVTAAFSTDVTVSLRSSYHCTHQLSSTQELPPWTPTSLSLESAQLSRLSRKGLSRLFGYSSVNDYFSSLSGESDSSDDDVGSNSHRAEGSSIENTYKKRWSPSDPNKIQTSSSSSAYANINDYFSSFNKNEYNDFGQAQDADSNEKWHGNDSFGINKFGGDIGLGGIDTHQPRRFQPTSSYADGDGYNQESALFTNPNQHMTYEEAIAYNNARLCPKLFLTQRAIQSFSFLLAECRDPHSGKWIEDFLGVQNLGNYHGTGAFNVTKYPTWDSVLLDMMSQKNEKMIVSAKRRGRGHGGWSKNNPHLQERWVEFPIDIRPASLVQRLLPVREQLAREFEKDLEIVGMVDGMIMESYFHGVKTKRDFDSDFESIGTQSFGSTHSTDLESSFDRIASEILTNVTESHIGGTSSSPLRRSNFDLLYSLCTQASTHRLLRELQRNDEDQISFQWLKRFYTTRLSEYFDGDQRLGRADDFVDALLKTPPSLMELKDGENGRYGKTMGLTDPLRICERIIALRSEVAREWIEIMREVKGDHINLNRVLIRVLMGKSIGEEESSGVGRMPPLSEFDGAFE